MSDRALSATRRAAAAGDPEAQARLAHLERRAGARCPSCDNARVVLYTDDHRAKHRQPIGIRDGNLWGACLYCEPSPEEIAESATFRGLQRQGAVVFTTTAPQPGQGVVDWHWGGTL